MPTDPDSARLGDVYITIRPSPRFFTSMPPDAAIAARSNRKWVWRNSSAASGPRRAAVAVESTRSVKTNVAVTDDDTIPPPHKSCRPWAVWHLAGRSVRFDLDGVSFEPRSSGV